MPLPSLTRYLLGLAAVVLAAGCFLMAQDAQAGLIIQAPTYAGLNNGLVGFWSFDGKSVSGTRVHDQSGQGNHGTMTNGPQLATGKLGQGLEFDGLNDYVSVNGLISTLANSTQGTVSYWAYMHRDNDDDNISFSISREADTTRTEVWISHRMNVTAPANTLDVRLTTDGVIQWGFNTGTNSLAPYVRNWLFVTLVHDGTEPRLYLNGVPQAVTYTANIDITKWFKSIITDATSDADTSNIGVLERGASDIGAFNGIIDDIRIYNRALSADEIKRLYKIGATAKIQTSLDGPQSGLVGWWTFDGPALALGRAPDASGNGKEGRLTGGAAPTAGKIGQGVRLDGTDDYVSVGNAGSGVKTISFWVKPQLSAATLTPQATPFPTAGASTWTVPDGVTSITVKAWGAGGGGGGNDNANSGGGDGGGGGYSTATVNVTGGTQITVRVGDGGVGGTGSGTTDAGGGGGGYSSATTSSADYVIAGGGGGGGAGADSNADTGGDGGAGGGTTGTDGGAGSAGADGGNGGGTSGGGSGGTGSASTSDGEAGETDGRHHGGDGGANRTAGTTGGGGAGGTIGGGAGGASLDGGGGGGAGYYGGGGGEAGNSNGGGGGGGGSSYTNGGTTSAGNGTTPGNDTDPDRATYCATAGSGGAGGPDGGNAGSDGNDGCVVITWNEGAAAVDDFKLIDLDGTDQIEITDSAIVATSFPAATVYVDGVKGTAVDASWHHVVIVDTTGVNASAMDIGRVSSSYLSGLIDDVRIYTRELSVDEIKRLYKNGATVKIGISHANDSLGKGLVGWWTFDGKDMAGVAPAPEYALDKSGNGNRGTLTNGPVRVAGKIGQGLQFDGADDYVDLGTTQFLNTGTPFTISAWVFFRGFKAGVLFPVIFASRTNTNTWRMAFTNDASFSDFTFGAQDTWRQARAQNIGINSYTNKWTHVLLTYNGQSASTLSNFRLYFDASEKTLTSVSGYGISTDNSAIGSAPSFGDHDWNGLIDDVRVYNRALSADEIKRLYNMGR